MSRNQSIRKEILLQLYGVRPLAKSAQFLTKEARKSGCDYRETEMVAECAFMEGMKLIEKANDPIGQVRYQITAEGVLAYENGE